MKKYYDILGIPVNSSSEKIKEAYRELAKKYHPDKHINNPLGELAAEKFKEVKEAYETLINSKTNNSYSESKSDNRSTDSNSNYSYRDNSYNADQKFDELFEKANHLVDLKMWRDLINLGSELVSISPNRSEAYAIKALGHYSVNEYTMAELYSNKAIERGNEEYYVLFINGVSLFQVSKFNDCVESFRKIIVLYREEPDVVGYLAMAYEKMGNSKTGKQYWDRLAFLDPNNDLLKTRKNVWDIGNGNYISKEDGKNTACAICLLLECIFDCF